MYQHVLEGGEELRRCPYDPSHLVPESMHMFHVRHCPKSCKAVSVSQQQRPRHETTTPRLRASSQSGHTTRRKEKNRHYCQVLNQPTLRGLVSKVPRADKDGKPAPSADQCAMYSFLRGTVSGRGIGLSDRLMGAQQTLELRTERQPTTLPKCFRQCAGSKAKSAVTVLSSTGHSSCSQEVDRKVCKCQQRPVKGVGSIEHTMRCVCCCTSLSSTGSPKRTVGLCQRHSHTNLRQTPAATHSHEQSSVDAQSLLLAGHPSLLGAVIPQYSLPLANLASLPSSPDVKSCPQHVLGPTPVYCTWIRTEEYTAIPSAESDVSSGSLQREDSEETLDNVSTADSSSPWSSADDLSLQKICDGDVAGFRTAAQKKAEWICAGDGDGEAFYCSGKGRGRVRAETVQDKACKASTLAAERVTEEGA